MSKNRLVEISKTKYTQHDQSCWNLLPLWCNASLINTHEISICNQHDALLCKYSSSTSFIFYPVRPVQSTTRPLASLLLSITHHVTICLKVLNLSVCSCRPGLFFCCLVSNSVKTQEQQPCHLQTTRR